MSSRRRATNARARERLQHLSRAAYTAAAGHLEVEPDSSLEVPPRRRWAVAPRAALVATAVLLALAAVVAVQALTEGAGAAPVPAGHGWAAAEDALGIGTTAGGTAGSDVGSEAASSGAGSEAGAPAGEAIDAAPGGSPGPGSAGGPGPAGQVVVVHVAGNVTAPGVVELPAGSRVHDALDAAGGPTPAADLAAVNLARLVVDGEQVYVPAPGEAAPAAASARGDEPAILDLNTATAQDLDELPGIGPVLAGRIVDWRAEHGRFTVVEELGEVSGIGPALLARLRDRVRV